MVVLERIRSALATSELTRVDIPRNYERAPQDGAADVDRFIENVEDYKARVHRIEHAAIALTVASLVTPTATVAVPSDVPTTWLRGLNPIADGPDAPLSLSQLDRTDAVLTGCRLAIAATGTIVLDAGPRQGRRALTLIPDHHICVVFANQLVDTLPQAFAALEAQRPLTFISGPSATSDIELERVEGVHGPRTLDVLLVRF
jgi:L-lactate dehydrogenase complex protein LldG